MSVNPVAASGAAGANVPVEQLIAAELAALAADAQALEAQLVQGQVVTAQVLPSNGLTDLINILGNRVAAALPPNLQPGDLFTAQVTGFNGTQILLQYLSTPEPGAAEPPPPFTNAPQEALPDEPLSALAAAAERPVLPDGIAPSLAPPPAVFVAGSIRPAPAGTATVPVTTPSSQALTPPPTVLADIEARLAAARAGSITVEAPVANANANANAPAGPPALPNAPATPASGTAALPNGAVPPPQIPGRFVLAPTIVPSARFTETAAPSTPQAPAAGEVASVTAGNAPPAPAGLAAFRDPAALVRALGLPVTPTNIASARLAINTPQRLPAALATLESALPESDDPRVATLRTLTAFFGKMEPSSPQLAAQISAYVDNVVTGNETKLVQLLTAQVAADQAANGPPSEATAAPGGANAPSAAPAAAQIPTLPVVALAALAERGAALSVDLKTQLLAIINAPPAGSETAGELVPAASSALTAVTAVQMNAAQALNVTPQTMAFTLPMWLGSQYAQAHIAIDRDAPDPQGKRGLDGDNFHIAFVLDTKHLGTVTVDLQTVGRSFSLAVKTENETSAKRFGEALTRLTGRLETLRYRVNSAEATVALRGAGAIAAAATAATTTPPADEGDGIASAVNLRA